MSRVHGSARLEGFSVKAPAGLDTFATHDAMITVLPEGKDSAVFGMDGIASVQADGSVEVSQSDHGISVGAMVDPPWAKDATGASLPTWYTVVGHKLVQHVDTRRAVFPIVADPRLTVGWGVYLNVTGAEAKALATAIMAVSGAGATAMCAGLVRLPFVLARFAAILCTTVGAPRLSAVYKAILSLWAGAASRSTYRCYQKRIVGPSTSWHAVAMKNCTG